MSCLRFDLFRYATILCTCALNQAATLNKNNVCEKVEVPSRCVHRFISYAFPSWGWGKKKPPTKTKHVISSALLFFFFFSLVLCDQNHHADAE